MKKLNISKPVIHDIAEKYKAILKTELEDYTKDDPKIQFLFWLGFLLGYIKEKPVQNIIHLIAAEFFENKSLLPDNIILVEVKKCRIYNEALYALKFKIENGDSFVNKYFNGNDVKVRLKTDGSQRLAFKREQGEYLIIYMDEFSMQELMAYLSPYELQGKNFLRDSMFKFYSIFHIHVPSFYSYLKVQPRVSLSRFNEFEELINQLGGYTSPMIYFWAKDMIDEGETVNFIRRLTHFKDIGKDIIKKFIFYLYQIKFNTILTMLKENSDENGVEEEIKLPLIQYPMKDGFAYNHFPGYSIHSFLNTGMNTFVRRKGAFKNQLKFKKSNLRKKTLRRKSSKKVNRRSGESRRFRPAVYLDVYISKGDVFKNLMQAILRCKTELLMHVISDKINDEKGNNEVFYNINYSFLFSVLRLKFDHLSAGMTLGDVVKNQFFKIRIPYMIYSVEENDLMSIKTGEYDPGIMIEFDDELLAMPLSCFFCPDNINLIAEFRSKTISEEDFQYTNSCLYIRRWNDRDNLNDLPFNNDNEDIDWD